jgi:hypothetical protein
MPLASHCRDEIGFRCGACDVELRRVVALGERWMTAQIVCITFGAHSSTITVTPKIAANGTVSLRLVLVARCSLPVMTGREGSIRLELGLVTKDFALR